MKIELQRQLFERYPLVLRPTHRGTAPYPLDCYGIECGDGWLHILEPLLDVFEQHAAAMRAAGVPRAKWPKVLQIKEKFGTLRAYIRAPSAPQLDAALKAAEAASSVTCEGCGKPAVLRQDGWHRVTCDECEQIKTPGMSEAEWAAHAAALQAVLKGRQDPQ